VCESAAVTKRDEGIVDGVTELHGASEPGGGRRCIFCESEGPLTREDVIPRWVADILNDMEPGDPEPEWRLHYTAGGLVERDRQHPTGDPTVIVRTVCERCNNGWMSELEERVKPIMEPMIRGQRVTLDVEQQLDVATWASKTVAALEFHEPTTVITRPEDRHLIREQLRPPHHHLVRLAYRDEYLESLVVKTLVARSDEAPDERPDSFATLLGIGFVIIQVWGGHGADTGGGLTRTGTTIDRAVMVWPPVPRAIDWPPPTPIPEDDFDDLAREVIMWADDSPDLAAWRATRRGDPS
jgi:hypothetical protein